MIIYSLLVYKFQNLIQADKSGIGLALLSGAVGSLGAVGCYILLSRAEASTIVPLTALYPALTVVLAVALLVNSLATLKLWVISFIIVYV